MTPDPTATGPAPTPLETYARLAAGTPAERLEIVLRLVEAHPEGRLELPARDGEHAILDGVDLGRVAVDDRPGVIPCEAPWWDPALGCLRLKGADLRGASLRRASLRGIDLSGADFRGAHLGGADLGGARLDGAQLAGADLVGALLEGASLGEADLTGAMLEEADLRKAVLRFSKLGTAVLENADLRGADLWGADLTGADLSDSDLRGAGLEEARCGGADLKGANFQDAVLRHATLRGSDLEGANLQGADLRGADLEGANLKQARLQDVDLTTCAIRHVSLNGARLEGARFEREQLGEAIGEERAGAFDEARKGYLVLERAFADLGDPDAASWAYRRRRRMQKLEALRQAGSERAAGRWRPAAGGYARYAGDQLAEWVCDYGDSIPRVLVSLLILYLAFTVLYGVTSSVVRENEGPSGTVRVLTHKPVDLAIFSLLAMTTGSIGIRLLPRHDLALVIVGLHVFLGVALIGLLGFVLGNRIRR